MPADRPNTVTLHLNPNDPQWLPPSTPFSGWDTRHGSGAEDFCEDATRELIPFVDQTGELPWSPRVEDGGNNDTLPLLQMNGVRFEPLGGLTTPNFLVPFYDWGIRAALFGKSSFTDSRLPFGDYFELIFDTPEARQSFIDVFGTNIKMTRTGRDSSNPANPVFIDEQRVYEITQSDSEFESDTTTWGNQTFYFLSWKDFTPNPVPNPAPPNIITDEISSSDNPNISTIVDIEFTDATGNDDIMGTCDTQNINPCAPVAPPECVNDGDCTSCNSKCISGTCICEDCPCNSVCINVDTDSVPGQSTSGPREIIDGDQENCVDCVHPLFGPVFCNCLAAIDSGICRPARDQEDGTNCDCKVGHVCCENFINGVSDSFLCCNVQEFGADGPGNIVQRCIDGFGCAQSACEVDADCDDECKECSLNENGVGTCTPKDNETPCGTDGLNCTWCQNGECVENPTTVNCNCPGQECDSGFDCCPVGFCCPSEFGCGEGSGCDQCDLDGDCPPCETCTQLPVGNRCTITDCPPCFTREEPDCECIIPVCRNCEDCTPVGDSFTCTENCLVCTECDENGNCTDPPECESDQTLNEETCECEDNCLECQVQIGTECVTDESICGCCTQCIEISGFQVCSNVDNSKCPAGDVCVNDSASGTCSCITPGCDPPCETIGGGCMECFISGSSGICVPPELAGLPDACNDTCEKCQFSGDCGDTTCDGDCCDDGSCCSAGNKCCDDFTDNSIYCCAEDEVCCGSLLPWRL